MNQCVSPGKMLQDISGFSWLVDISFWQSEVRAKYEPLEARQSVNAGGILLGTIVCKAFGAFANGSVHKRRSV